MTILIAAVFAAVSAYAAPLIRTAADFRTLTNCAEVDGHEFKLTGTVVKPLYNLNFLLRDSTGGVYITRESGEPVQAGDIVQVSGVAKNDRNRFGILLAKKTVKTDISPAPQPIEAEAEKMAHGCYNWQYIQLKGFVRDAFQDEIDPRWNILILNCNSHIIYAAFPDSAISGDRLNGLIDAVISVKGVCLPSCGGRRFFFGQHVEMAGFDDIEIIEHAPEDPFNTPLLNDIRHLQPKDIFGMRRRRATGCVLAVWNSNRFLLETADGRIIRVELLENVKAPEYADAVEVVGFPETDLYRINLSRALYRKAEASMRPQTPQDAAPDEILRTPDGKAHIKTEYHGRTLRMRGFVRSLPATESGGGKMNIECDGHPVKVDVSACAQAVHGMDIGSELEITGTCVFDTENWRPPALFPRIEEFLLVARTPADIKVLSNPPWWTHDKLLVVIGILLAVLGGIAVWNRLLNHVVDRRTRELMKERLAHASAVLKVEERTRLAVELHDTLAQHLTGMALQIDATQMAAEEDPRSVMPYIENTRRKMQNCRENLRNCLWDLRSRAFEEKHLAEAIRKTIAPHAGNTEIDIDIDIPCRKLSDNTIHAVLCIIRELAINAIRHGRATVITVTGHLDNEGVSLTVSDNGRGFNPDLRPGLSDGHFGLQGIIERVHRLGGKFTVDSACGRGTIATLIHLNPEA